MVKFLCSSCRSERESEYFGLKQNGKIYKSCTFCRKKALSSYSDKTGKVIIKYNKEFLPKDLIDKLLTKYKKTSVKTYENSIRRLFKLCFDKDEYDFKLIEDEDNFIKGIEEHNSEVKEKYNMFSKTYMIVKYFLMTEENKFTKLTEYYKELKQKVDNLITFKASDEKDIKRIIDIAKLREYYISIDGDKFETADDYETYLIISLYLLIPPLRPSEYSNCHLYYPKTKPDYKDIFEILDMNFIDMVNNKMIVGKSKTLKDGELRIFDINKRIVDIITKMKPFKGDDRKKKLFIDKNHDDPKKLSDKIEQLNGTNASGMRKSYITYINRNIKKDEKGLYKRSDIEKKKKAAYIMGHKLSTADYIYQRNIIDEKK